MAVGLQHGVNHLTVHRGDVPPGGVRVAFDAGGGLVDLIQGAAFAFPGVRQAVDDDHVITGLLGLVDGFDVVDRAEAPCIVRAQLKNVKIDLVGVETQGTTLGVDGCDLASGPANARARYRAAQGFPCTSWPVKGNTGLELVLGGFYEWH